MLKKNYPYYLANKPKKPNQDLEVRDKYSGKVAACVAKADRKAVKAAIEKSVAAAEPMRRLPSHKRQAVLQHCVRQFERRKEELALSLCIEAGKAIQHSRGEVSRLIDTFRYAAEEAVRLGGEVMPLDITPQAVGYRGMYKRVPIGPCFFITPFNFPLNLAAHKIAPALAVGCPFILKPASLTPLGALIIGEVLAETDLPEGAFSILPCSHDDAELILTDDRIKLLSFTGSHQVGWELKKRCGKKKVCLELGGNAACIVDRDADLKDAVERIVFGAFYQSGQSCISVQRILVHEAVYDEFKKKLAAATKKLKMGEPKKEETFIGPLIEEKEAERVESWIRSALDHGANLVCGGKRRGVMVEPTLLENVPGDETICREEVFGPVALLAKFSDFDDALRRVNDSAYGINAGVFTRDLYRAMHAWDELDVGGVIVGDVPSWRVDHMPYGGVKDSGLGREGLRFSMEEMSEIRLLVIREAR